MKTSRLFVAMLGLIAGAMPAFAVVTAPTQVPGLKLWLDANDLDGDGVAEGTGETYTNGWADKSGLANHFVQNTPANLPAAILAGQAGKTVLKFDNVNDHFTGPAVLTGNDDNYTYIAVFRPTDGGNIHSVYEQAGPGGSARSALLQVNGAYGFNGESNDRHDLIPIKANLWRYADMTVDNAANPNITIIENGVTFSGNTGNPAALNIGTAGATVGRKQQVSGEFMAGNIAEILVYDRILTAQEHSDIAAYINQKWGLTGIQSLQHRWSFNDGTANDSVGTAHGTLNGGATIVGGKLSLDGINDYVQTSPINGDISTKTLVAWVSLANLTQQAGGVLTLENPTGADTFDSIVYGEQTANRWMNGSNNFLRTQDVQAGNPAESSLNEVMIAIVYGADNSINLYRDGILYASYTKGGLINYPGGVADVLLGLRHSDIAGGTGTPGGNDQFWAGLINDARIYSAALTAEDVRTLFALGADRTGLEAIVPEPATFSLIALTLAGLAAQRRRREA
jgi:hypothetical protein